MICPECGSRDVESTSNPEWRIQFCQCLHCQHRWKEPYDPGNSIPVEEKKIEDKPD